jgi:hypothetical protein
MKSGVSEIEDKKIEAGKSGILMKAITMAVTVNGANRKKGKWDLIFIVVHPFTVRMKRGESEG